MWGECEEGGGGSESDQKKTDTTASCDHHVETGREVESGVSQSERTVGIKRQHQRLGQRLTQYVEQHPEQDQSGNAVAPLSRIDEQREEPDQETQDKATAPGKVGGTGELDPVVVEDGFAAEEFGEKSIAEVVEELGDDDPEGGSQSGCNNQGRADPLQNAWIAFCHLVSRHGP